MPPKPTRLLPKVLLAFAGLLLVLVAGAYWYLSTLDVGEYRAEIAQAVKEETGRELKITGAFTLDIFPDPKLVAEGVTLSNAEWATRPRFITVDRVEAEVSLKKLLTGTVEVTRIALLRPTVNLETDTEGRGNWVLWDIERDDDDSVLSASDISIDVSNVEVRDARVSFREAAKDTTRVVNVDEMLIKSKGSRQPVTISVRGRDQGRVFNIGGEMGSIVNLLNNDPYKVDLRFQMLDSKLTVKGGVKQPMDFHGIAAELALSTPALKQLLEIVGASTSIALPVDIRAQLRDEESGYMLEKILAVVGTSDVTGSVRYADTGEGIQISASLDSKVLDLDEMWPPDENAEKVFPDTPLPLDTLRSVDANVALKGARVVSSGVVLSPFSLDASLRDGRLTLNTGGGLYGGTVAGSIDYHAASKKPRMDIHVNAKQFDLGALVNAREGSEVMTGGRSDLSLKLRGYGANPRAIAGSSSGELVTKVGSSKLSNTAVKTIGADVLMSLVRAVTPAEEDDEVTHLECGVVRMDFNDGIGETDRGIAAETKRVNVTGSGTIDLKTEEVDIAIRTEPKEGLGLSASSLSSLVQVGGTLANPSPELDPVGALKTGATVGAALATGGLSLLGQALFNRVTADDAPCDTALGIKKTSTASAGTPRPRSRNAEEAGTSSSPQPVSKPSSRGAEEGSGTAPAGDSEPFKGIGETLKGIFGN